MKKKQKNLGVAKNSRNCPRKQVDKDDEASQSLKDSGFFHIGGCLVPAPLLRWGLALGRVLVAGSLLELAHPFAGCFVLRDAVDTMHAASIFYIGVRSLNPVSSRGECTHPVSRPNRRRPLFRCPARRRASWFCKCVSSRRPKHRFVRCCTGGIARARILYTIACAFCACKALLRNTLGRGKTIHSLVFRVDKATLCSKASYDSRL